MSYSVDGLLRVAEAARETLAPIMDPDWSPARRTRHRLESRKRELLRQRERLLDVVRIPELHAEIGNLESEIAVLTEKAKAMGVDPQTGERLKLASGPVIEEHAPSTPVLSNCTDVDTEHCRRIVLNNLPITH